MSAYESRLRGEKKVELSHRVTSSIVDDIWYMSYVATDAQEFIDYLMTITNEEAVEEFFNKCHDEGGRFCGGSSGGKGKRGPGTRVPAPLDYVKQQVREKVKTTSRRADSAPLSKVTTSPGRRVVDIATGLGFNPSGFGTVKIRKLQRADLSRFGTKDLNTLKTRLQASQRQYNKMHTMGWTMAAAGAASVGKEPVAGGALLVGAAYSIGLSRWKTRRIPAQIERVDRALARRSKLADIDLVELALADDNLPTLAQEIAAARKEIESGTFPKVTKLSSSDLKEVETLLSDVDEDDDMTSEQIKAVKESLANYKNTVN